ncbi:TetR/AcrR family transcriptional regulator [Streptomyces sp. NRRL F-5135]|uniref:TetR/AcrR family transcriptional regulator n=1 Tax=Streptomyces sp. NRRL F-5135 TaxID=1463858 RepID=UPI0004C85606|nr:TetR/AcrR family transcriptional regulator [Streptomyces sp. NRRL F-5135]
MPEANSDDAEGTRRKVPDRAATTARPRRRQARGERRIAQILDAAATVFSTAGYTGASTNAIAREAGISPGTLYQFFPNKEAIAVELGDQLLRRWRATYGRALTPAHLELPLEELLEAVLDPLIRFNHENPAFGVLMHGPDVPGKIAMDHADLHSSLVPQVEGILSGYLSEASPAEVSRIARLAFATFKAGLDLTLSVEPDERDAYITELKTLLFRYLQPLVEDCRARPASSTF